MDEAILQAHDNAQEASPLLVHGRLLSVDISSFVGQGRLLITGDDC
jgi:hypothetical protein